MDPTLEQQRDRFDENPDSITAFEVLEERYFMDAEWEALADLYRRRMAAPSLAEHPKQRAQLALRLGQLLEERLSDLDAAIEALTEARRLDPELQPTLQHLHRLYSSKRSWETVLQIAELEIAGSTSSEERARLYSEMGDIWLRELDDQAQAEQFYERARQEGAGAEPVAPDDEAESPVQRAWIAAARGDSDAALASLGEALECDPGDTEALDMMLTVLEGAGRHVEMDALLIRRASLAGDPETRAAVLIRLGSVREEHLGDLDNARDAYEQARELAPDDARAVDALKRLVVPEAANPPGAEESEEQHAERIVGVLERKLAALESNGERLGPDAVKLRLRLGELHAGSLRDPATAVAVLEPAAESDDSLCKVAPVLVDLYERLGRYELVASLAERAGAQAEDPAERVEWYRRAAETAREGGDGDGAIVCYQKLLSESPHDRGAAASLRDLYRARGEHAPLAERLRAELAYADETEESPLHRELASLLAGSLDDSAGSIAHLRRWLELEPDPGGALDDALHIADGAGGVFAQLDILDHVAERARSEAARAIAFARRGSLFADRLEWVEEADESWHAALAIDPAQPEALARLEASS